MQLLKTILYALAAFLAACSVNVGAGGAVLIQLPPPADFISHPDLYAAGLLVLVEIFSRLLPSSANYSPLAFLARLADSVLKNRADSGGIFSTETVLTRGTAA